MKDRKEELKSQILRELEEIWNKLYNMRKDIDELMLITDNRSIIVYYLHSVGSTAILKREINEL